jgi:hypothetical protein
MTATAGTAVTITWKGVRRAHSDVRGACSPWSSSTPIPGTRAPGRPSGPLSWCAQCPPSGSLFSGCVQMSGKEGKPASACDSTSPFMVLTPSVESAVSGTSLLVWAPYLDPPGHDSERDHRCRVPGALTMLLDSEQPQAKVPADGTYFVALADKGGKLLFIISDTWTVTGGTLACGTMLPRARPR